MKENAQINYYFPLNLSKMPPKLACPGAPLWQAYIDDADFHLTLFDTFLVLLLSVSLKPILFYKKEGKMNIINV